jgi:hypothetical protein
MVAWGGLGIPMDLTVEQQKAIQGRIALPPHTPQSLINFNIFFEGRFRQCLAKNGYDPTQHFSVSLLQSKSLENVWEAEN